MATRFRGSDVSFDFDSWSARFSRLHLDLGTGDGAYVLRKARQDAATGVVGIDTCLDHLRGAAKRYPGNVHFIRCDARVLPEAFTGTFGSLSINFPFGSLLEAIAGHDEQLLDEISRVAADRCDIGIVINESALERIGAGFEDGRRVLERFGWLLPGFTTRVTELDANDLRAFPSDWSRRQGYGRRPRGIRLTGVRRSGHALPRIEIEPAANEAAVEALVEAGDPLLT